MKSILAETTADALRQGGENIMMTTPVTDIHTTAIHQNCCFGASTTCSSVILWSPKGFAASTFPMKFWAYQDSRADLIWQALFIQTSPISDVPGVLTTLHGRSRVASRSPRLRPWFSGQAVRAHLDRCLELGGLGENLRG
jgi:hypothetical protein